jgi:hypothetical protein
MYNHGFRGFGKSLGAPYDCLRDQSERQNRLRIDSMKRECLQAMANTFVYVSQRIDRHEPDCYFYIVRTPAGDRRRIEGEGNRECRPGDESNGLSRQAKDGPARDRVLDLGIPDGMMVVK